MSFINKELPEFKVNAYHNDDFVEVTNKDLEGHWSVLFFYPADFTFVCPTELEDLVNNYEALKAEGVEVYSVSCDTHFTHKAWADASENIRNIKFPMLSDANANLAKYFDIYLEDEGLSLRGTFVFNPEGQCKLYEIHDNGIGRNASELLRKVQAAKFVGEHGDQVCPANWKPGAETLTPGIDLVGKV